MDSFEKALYMLPADIRSAAEQYRDSPAEEIRLRVGRVPTILICGEERSLGSLSGAELSEITRLGDIVGRYELAEQTRALELCLAELRNCLRAAQSAYPGEKKLGFGLAAAAGALLVVVLL